MLETLDVNLSATDEPLLEASLADRGERVRAIAARLLAQLPGSALAGRIQARAGATLTFDGVTLDANPPAATDASWARDGLGERSISQKSGQRAFWLAQIVERTPPAYWERRFGRGPEELVAATASAKWRTVILSAWTAAAARFQATAWAGPLWDAWLGIGAKELKQAGDDRASLCAPLAPLLPPAALEAFALRMLADPGAYDGVPLYEALDWLPRPWGLAVGGAYLHGLRAFVGALPPNARLAEPWDDTLDSAALALPEALFARALEPVAVPESSHWPVKTFDAKLSAFAETIRLRERIVRVLSA
jgi:hypothetical protein